MIKPIAVLAKSQLDGSDWILSHCNVTSINKNRNRYSSNIIEYYLVYEPDDLIAIEISTFIQTDMFYRNANYSQILDLAKSRIR